MSFVPHAQPVGEPMGLWFTVEELRAVDVWYQQVARPDAMPVMVSVAHPEAAEMIEIGLSGAGRDEPRWMVCRTVEGVCLQDLYRGRTYTFETMDEALNRIDKIKARELECAAAKLPESLMPA